ncbi:GNAT family N-acetyltransferase [Paroceanicella profunda]|uniref:GNAT family N-acetyltransferase n=1 Tax=Paroceanicella profunda TaxID=2579971 RepID=A0A5B8G0Y6_9RHOB|nr:GNAT family N-acetyltransferase [Paroceanicella profunda]QDL93490.1 GNAT family N-acetyltransferase [Paroceanicella profunda]
MTPEAMALLHAQCFDAHPRPWSAAEFADVLSLGAWQVSVPGGFALGRVAGGEAELITLAVVPERRRQGLALRLLTAFDARALADRAEEAFLEVSEANAPARALYLRAGWALVGRRYGYYGRGAQRVDALVMRRSY